MCLNSAAQWIALFARNRLTLVFLFAPLLCWTQTASNISAADPNKSYYALKRVLQSFYDEGALRSNLQIEPVEPASKGRYDVEICVSGSEFVGRWPSAENLNQLADLAGRIVIWRSDLRKLGYPEPVWRPMLVAFEDQQVMLLIKEQGFAGDWENRLSYKNRERFEFQLAAALNAYRSRQNPQLRGATREGGCGAGEIGVNIRVRPPNGEVLFMPMLLYRYCKAQAINPDDPQACNYWKTAPDGVLYQVSGSYQYWARWPDGATRRGSVDFSKYEDQQTISFAKP